MSTIRRMLIPVVCSTALVLTGCSQIGMLGASGQNTVTVETSPAKQGGQAAAESPQANKSPATAAEKQSDKSPATAAEKQSDNDSAAGTREKRSHKDRYENMLLPPGAEPANEAAINGWYDAGRYMSLYVGNNNTSIPFANEIHNTWLSYADPHKTNPPITFKAWSEVKKANFTVTCEEGPKYVTCKGGYNAIVYIV